MLSFRTSTLLLALAALSVGCTTPRTAGTPDARPYQVISPPGLEAARAPVLLVLHGGMSSADEFRSRFSMVEAAARGRFHVAYLNGTRQRRRDRRVWNAGGCCGAAQRDGVDDVAYLDGVIGELTARGLADPERVYLLGSSNGAMMAYRYACERPRRVAGIVAVSGALVPATCRDARGVRVLHVHSYADTSVPVEGGGAGVVARLTGVQFPSVAETVGALRAAGASVETVLLQGGEHAIQTLDAAMRRERGVGLDHAVADFVR